MFCINRFITMTVAESMTSRAAFPATNNQHPHPLSPTVGRNLNTGSLAFRMKRPIWTRFLTEEVARPLDTKAETKGQSLCS